MLNASGPVWFPKRCGDESFADAANERDYLDRLSRPDPFPLVTVTER